MADGKYKPCSFYVPEKDTELLRFMAAQSNMSMSMRLLMKAFLASNRHETDIDVSTMDLADLVRSMRVDPELFEDVPRKRRPARSISAIEAEEARASRQVPEPAPVPAYASGPAPAAQHAPAPAPEPVPASVPESVPAQEPAPAPVPKPVPAPSPAPAPETAAPGPLPEDGDDLDPMSMMGE